MRRFAAFVMAVAAFGTAAAQLGPALDPALRRALAPVLSQWIASTRDAILELGAEEIPREIRDALTGFVPDDVLDEVRWRADEGVLSVQQSLFRLGYTPAVTLDHVVVFATSAHALDDPALWAHELYHVMQYREWGVEGFAARYLEDYAAVEHEAAEFRWRWMQATGRVPAP